MGNTFFLALRVGSTEAEWAVFVVVLFSVLPYFPWAACSHHDGKVPLVICLWEEMSVTSLFWNKSLIAFNLTSTEVKSFKPSVFLVTVFFFYSGVGLISWTITSCVGFEEWCSWLAFSVNSLFIGVRCNDAFFRWHNGHAEDHAVHGTRSTPFVKTKSFCMGNIPVHMKSLTAAPK